MTIFLHGLRAVLLGIVMSGVHGVVAADGQPAQVSQLIEQLENPEAAQRVQAVRSLGEIGPEARSAIPRLMTLLNDQTSAESIYVTVGDSAVDTLVEIGSEAVFELTNAVKEDDSETARAAAVALERIGPKAWPALPALIGRVNSPDVVLRHQLIDSISELDQTGETAIPVLLPMLRDHEPEIREAAASALGSYGTDSADAIDALLSLLHDRAPVVRAHAALALAQIRVNPEKIVPALTPLLNDEATYEVAVSNHVGMPRPVAADIVSALAEFGNGDSVEALIAAARNINSPIWQEAVVSLGTFKNAAERTIPVLMEFVRSGEVVAGIVLGKLGPAASACVPKLTELLKSSDDDVRTASAAALVGIDVQASQDALRMILDLLNDKDSFGTGNLAEQVFLDLGPKAAPATPNLIAHLEGEYFLNWTTARILGQIGPAARDAGPILIRHLGKWGDSQAAADALIGIGLEMIPLLQEAAEDPESPLETRVAAVKTLGRFGPRAHSVVPSLIRLLTDDSRGVRVAAAEALGEIGADPDHSVPALIQRLHDPRSVVRAQAAASLGHFGSGARAAIPDLINVLDDEYLDVRAAAAEALGEIGSSAHAALPALQKVQTDSNQYVAAKARKALSEIGGLK
jgi:HEAT repeat protein